MAITTATFEAPGFSLSPPLQRFGIVTGLAIVFALVPVVTMVPGLPVIRERLLSGVRSRSCGD